MTCLEELAARGLLAAFSLVNGDLTEQQQENLCAQIKQESVFVADAVSPAGARGLTQFMRPTWGDVGPVIGCPEFDQAFNPDCSLRAQRQYMETLIRSRICQGDSSNEPWALAYSCYNAGLGWIRKERRLCAGPLHPNCDPSKWFDNVENTCLRSASSCHETQTYNVRIRQYGAREITNGHSPS